MDREESKIIKWWWFYEWLSLNQIDWKLNQWDIVSVPSALYYCVVWEDTDLFIDIWSNLVANNNYPNRWNDDWEIYNKPIYSIHTKSDL